MSIFRLRSRYYLIGGLLLLLLLMGVWLLAGRLPLFQTSSLIDSGLDPARELYRQNVLWLSEEAEVRQEFVSAYPGLYQVNIFLTAQEELDRDITLAFHLKESCASPDDLRRIVAAISEADIGGEVFYPFTFSPIDESTNRKICFVLEPLIVPDAEKVVGVWASKADVYSEGEAYYQTPPEEVKPKTTEIVAATSQQKPNFDHQVFLPIIYAGQADALPASFDVGFQLHYNGRPLDTINVFVTRLVSYKPYFWGNPWFYILLLISYLGSVYLLMRVRLE